MRCVAKYEHRGSLLFSGKFTKELHGVRSRKQQIRFAYFLFVMLEGAGEDLRGLHCADIGAGEHQIRDRANLRDTLSHLLGFFHAFVGQKALRVSGALGILAVDGDAVANDVQLHAWTTSRRLSYKRHYIWDVTMAGMVCMSKGEEVVSSQYKLSVISFA